MKEIKPGMRARVRDTDGKLITLGTVTEIRKDGTILVDDDIKLREAKRRLKKLKLVGEAGHVRAISPRELKALFEHKVTLK